MQIGPFTVDPANRKEGGQAFVYFSIDPRTGDRVAIKVARPSRWSRRRMRREILVQKELVHPNILPVLVHGPEFDWYATRQAECSLEELGPLGPDQWPYLRVGLMAVTSAVAHAHARGYVHRDISAGNVLVFAHGWAVCDWGFVYSPPKKGAARMTQPLERFGTPDFMAPEMATDPSSVGPAADVYSIGRLAVWATGLKRGEGYEDDRETVWWRRLIDSTTAYEPQARWTIADLGTYLKPKPIPSPTAHATLTSAGSSIVDSSQTLEPCPQCGSQRGRDATEHCLDCHTMVPY